MKKDSVNSNDEFLSDDTKKLVALFEQKEAIFQAKLNYFFDAYGDDLTALDNSREEMNAALDDARRELRADAERAPYTKVKTIKFGGFSIAKKWSSWFIVDMFVSLVRNCGMYDSAVAEGVIQEKTEVNGKLAEEWLRKNSLTQQFRQAEDGKELTPAISGPKAIAPFGSPKKK